MSTYNVLLLLHAPNPSELLDRLHEWDLVDDEHVLSITAVPDPIVIPPALGAKPIEIDPPTNPLPMPPPVRAPDG
ncbi:MAG: hypothetical protein L3J91_01000 [Thermoplasmata archaeon]|nr:hypothetical protein [Thermoplasmata archaeon]